METHSHHAGSTMKGISCFIFYTLELVSYKKPYCFIIKIKKRLIRFIISM